LTRKVFVATWAASLVATSGQSNSSLPAGSGAAPRSSVLSR